MNWFALKQGSRFNTVPTILACLIHVGGKHGHVPCSGFIDLFSHVLTPVVLLYLFIFFLQLSEKTWRWRFWTQWRKLTRWSIGALWCISCKKWNTDSCGLVCSTVRFLFLCHLIRPSFCLADFNRSRYLSKLKKWLRLFRSVRPVLGSKQKVDGTARRFERRAIQVHSDPLSPTVLSVRPTPSET